MRFEDIIKRPVISEKGTMQTETARQYLFEVDPTANKTEIANAVSKFFKVKVVKVRTMVVHGKTKAIGGKTWRALKKRPNWKKAVVTLGEGEKIEFFKG